jgi:ABC-type sugar transport system permease subunit
LFGVLIMAMGFWTQYGPERSKSLTKLMGFAVVIPVAMMFPGGWGVPFGLVAGAAALMLLARSIQDKWVIWMFLAIAGTIIFWSNLWRFPILVAAAIGFFELVRRKNAYFTGSPKLRWTGVAIIILGTVLVVFGKIWIQPLGQFVAGTPAWLGQPDLVIPALIFWGFPWVGTVGVLIYLSGLQNIPQDVYEAAELDGVSPLGMILRIELPLIMTQVRINMIFITIGTLTAYEMFFILLGIDGGPGNRGMVPGLYMFREAFNEARFGYACALGMVLFVIVLGLTIIYQKYVKVDK